MIKNSLSIAIASSLLSVASFANATDFEVSVTNLTTGVYFTPLIISAHSPEIVMFETGGQASPELQTIAEGGNVASMAALFEGAGASVATGAGLLAPGATQTLTVSSSDINTVLSLTSMLLPTNDGFLGLNRVALPTSMGTTTRFDARVYDAGTEGNDERVGTAAVGEAGFPAPPPVVASGLGTGGTGFDLEPEGFISIHRGVLGDLDPNGGPSDINAAVHRWNNPVATITVTMVGGDANGGPSAVASLSGQVYSSSAVEIFWEAASSDSSFITGYEVERNGELVSTIDGLSFFEEGLNAGTEITYNVRAIDANGSAGEATQVILRTNAN